MVIEIKIICTNGNKINEMLESRKNLNNKKFIARGFQCAEVRRGSRVTKRTDMNSKKHRDLQTKTVGKNKNRSLYVTIIYFPNPQPRNIEKDIKVFLWSSVIAVLGKIFRREIGENEEILW
ncbi:hypothetical protein Glove_365g228 [Diversispora epigaea]|uniref:DUF7082 domain-containing protein n=1 Tax=Diversispora epigaea TaxID=1348612 RepID=A0A397H7P9_9GLOM|nr:hypothetical protein Glove_365g228 [Diversispora epigaea]